VLGAKAQGEEKRPVTFFPSVAFMRRPLNGCEATEDEPALTLYEGEGVRGNCQVTPPVEFAGFEAMRGAAVGQLDPSEGPVAKPALDLKPAPIYQGDRASIHEIERHGKGRERSCDSISCMIHLIVL
jgi:hypothetical protein